MNAERCNPCEHCGMDIDVRNPSGFCDHLYYPERCSVCRAREGLPKFCGHFARWGVNVGARVHSRGEVDNCVSLAIEDATGGSYLYLTADEASRLALELTAAAGQVHAARAASRPEGPTPVARSRLEGTTARREDDPCGKASP